jgi:hypothetical protein
MEIADEYTVLAADSSAGMGCKRRLKFKAVIVGADALKIEFRPGVPNKKTGSREASG